MVRQTPKRLFFQESRGLTDWHPNQRLLVREKLVSRVMVTPKPRDLDREACVLTSAQSDILNSPGTLAVQWSYG